MYREHMPRKRGLTWRRPYTLNPFQKSQAQDLRLRYGSSLKKGTPIIDPNTMIRNVRTFKKGTHNLNTPIEISDLGSS